MKFSLAFILFCVACHGQGLAVYSGFRSHEYTNRAFAKRLPVTVPVVPNLTNFLTMVAVNKAGIESDFGTEISFKSITNSVQVNWLIASNVVIRVLQSSNVTGTWIDTGIAFTNTVTNGTRYWMLSISKLN